MKTVKIFPNFSVLDMVSLLYGDLALTYKFLTDNPFITDIDMSLEDFAARAVIYDETLSSFTPPQLDLSPPPPPDNIGTIKSLHEQSLYDLVLMTYGTLDKLYKFITDNNISGLSANNIEFKNYTFDTTMVKNPSIYSFNIRNHIIYCTGVDGGISYELRDDLTIEFRDNSTIEFR